MALFQRVSDGFVFTSKAIVKDDALDQELSKTVVVPTASNSNPPLLKDVNTKPRPVSTGADQSKKNTGGMMFMISQCNVNGDMGNEDVLLIAVRGPCS